MAILMVSIYYIINLSFVELTVQLHVGGAPVEDKTTRTNGKTFDMHLFDFWQQAKLITLKLNAITEILSLFRYFADGSRESKFHP